jgi:hypothetical protein
MSNTTHGKLRAVETFSTLSPDEQRLIEAYRTMDDRCKVVTRRQAERKAENWPAPAPLLRLVAGGASQ